MSQSLLGFRAVLNFSFIAILLFYSGQSAAYSVLRVYCQEDNAGAEVYINNNRKGQCVEESPLDVFIEAGNITVKAVKKVDQDRERVFQETITLAEGAPKRVWVTLSAPRLTAAAAERQRIEQLRKEKAAFEEALSKAGEGDIKAMKEVAGYFREGKGAKKDVAKSDYWVSKAKETQEIHNAHNVLAKASGGDVAAMREMASRYQQGKGVKQSAEQAVAWQEKAETTAAQNALRLAKQGNIKAMQQLSEYYQLGRGVEKSAAKSKEWQEKAEIEEQREKQRIAAQEKLENYDPLPISNAMESLLEKTGQQSGPFALMVSIPETVLYLGYLPVLTIESASSPVHSTIESQLKKKASARASAFMAPDAMVAKAYAALDHGH